MSKPMVTFLDIPYQPYDFFGMQQRHAGWRCETHTDCQYGLVYCFKNSFDLIFPERKITLVSGSAIIIPPGIPHSLISNDGCSFIDIYFTGKNDERNIWAAIENLNKNMFVASLNNINVTFDDLLRFLYVDDAFKYQYYANVFDTIAISYINEYRSITESEFRKTFLSIILDEKNTEIRINDICKMMNISRTHLNRLTHKEFGMSTKDYIDDLRLKKACDLLKSKSLTIKEISEMLGFYDNIHFTRFFKKNIGETPLKYKNNS